MLQNLTDPNSDEHQHLIEALIGMEKVAEHINEMQRIHEEYGAIFDHLFRQHQKSSKQVSNANISFSEQILQIYFLQPIDLSPGDLLYYGGVEWLNISDFLGKIKKVTQRNGTHQRNTYLEKINHFFCENYQIIL